MKKRYEYLYNRYHFLVDEKLDWVRLVNNSKEKEIKLLNMDILFLKEQKEYMAIFEIDEILEMYHLDFALSNRQYSSLFFHYIYQFLTSSNPCFYKVINGIVAHDYHEDLCKLKTLKISNMIIKKDTMYILKAYFPQLRQVTFEDCFIEKSCNFKDFNGSLFFIHCKLEELFSLQEFKGELYISSSSINHFQETVIFSPTLQINGEDLSDEQLTMFFSKTYLPRLESLEVGETLSIKSPEKNPVYHHCLFWIPASCPQLLTLSISGIVYSFNFLYHFHNLGNCEIYSKNYSTGSKALYLPDILDEQEKLRIINQSKRKIETDLDVSLALLDGLNQILKISSQFRYTKQEENIYLKKDMTSLDFYSSYEIEELKYYFKRNSSNSLELHSGYGKNYQMVANRLYEIKPLLKTAGLSEKPKVILPKSLIYHPSGIPILLPVSKRPKEKTKRLER